MKIVKTISIRISEIKHPKNKLKEKDLKYKHLIKYERPTLGPSMVILWRLLRRCAIPKVLGKATGKTVYILGKEVGKTIPVKTIPELLEKGKELGVGIFKIIATEEERVLLQLDECVTCSGTPNIGKAVCDFELGMIAGALEKITNKKVIGEEVKCNGLGDKTCWLDYKFY